MGEFQAYADGSTRHEYISLTEETYKLKRQVRELLQIADLVLSNYNEKNGIVLLDSNSIETLREIVRNHEKSV